MVGAGGAGAVRDGPSHRVPDALHGRILLRFWCLLALGGQILVSVVMWLTRSIRPWYAAAGFSAVSYHLQYKFWNIRSFQRVAAQPWGMCHSLTWLCISRMLKLYRFWRVSSLWFIFLMDSWWIHQAENSFDDIAGKVVADFGCGCGTLAVASALLDAGWVCLSS